MANFTTRLLIVAQKLRDDDTVEIVAKRFEGWEDTLTFTVTGPEKWPVGRNIDVLAHPVP